MGKLNVFVLIIIGKDPNIISTCSKSFDEKRWLALLARTTVVVPKRENENCTPPLINIIQIGPLPFDELSEGFTWAKREEVCLYI